MQIIPLQATPSQRLTVSLANQTTQLEVYQTATGVYMNVYVNNNVIIGGVICRNLDRIVRDAYLGFIGDLAFNDNEGLDDPVYTGLGSRFSLCYLEASDL